MKTNTQKITRKIIFIFSFFYFLNVNAQVPEKMSFQAVVRNTSNQLITNQSVGIKISILEPLNMNPVVYSETHQATTNTNGLVTIEIGNGSIVLGVFKTIQWDAGTHGIQCEIDPTGGTNYTISTVTQFLSVPYALHSKSTSSISGTNNNVPKFTSNNTIGKSNISEGMFGKIGIGNSNPQYTLDLQDNTPVINLKNQYGFNFASGMTYDSQGFLGTFNNSSLYFYTNSLPRLKIESNGDVKVKTNLQIGESGSKITSIQSGTFGFGNSSYDNKEVTINFEQPMPNKNYAVTVNQIDPQYYDFFQFLIRNKTVNGFNLIIVRRDANTGWSQFPSVDWIAICK
jgi:hypothetical protein